ncbi:putative Myb/SANT-like domain-containing protein [Dioscorea sansibarensis]
MSSESHNLAGKTSTNFRWTTIMTSFMLTSLVEQANLGLRSDKGYKNVALNTIVRAVSATFNLAVSDTHVNNLLWHVRKIWSIIKKIKSLSDVS